LLRYTGRSHLRGDRLNHNRAAAVSHYCFIMTMMSDSIMDAVRKKVVTHLTDEPGMETCTETVLPSGASRAPLPLGGLAMTLPLGSVTTMVMAPMLLVGSNWVASKPASRMMLVASLMMSGLPYWWRAPVRQPLRAAAQRACLTIIPRAISSMPRVSGPRTQSRTRASSTAATACLPPRPVRPDTSLVALGDLLSMARFLGMATVPVAPRSAVAAARDAGLSGARWLRTGRSWPASRCSCWPGC